MTFLETPAESPLYAADLAAMGYVANYTKVFALLPEVMTAWKQLGSSVKSGMDERRYELATLAAARSIGSDYCSLAHAGILQDRYYDKPALAAIVADHHDAGLDAADVAIMDFAGKVAADPTKATAADIEGLRSHGLSDVDILQVVLTACIRRFFSGVLSAVGAEPDAALDKFEPEVKAALI